MRGRIIHYNAMDGRGLISDGGRQYPFEIAEWQSEMAPALNAAVDFTVSGDRPVSVTRVPDDVLLREKAGALAGRFSAMAGGAATGEGAAIASSSVARLGKPLLMAHAAFVLGAVLLTYVSLGAMGAGRAYTLFGLSKLADIGGMEVGSTALVWLAVFAPGLPLVWRSSWCWMALLLPLAAVLKPWWDLKTELSRLSGNPGMDAEFAAEMMKQVNAMVDFGFGAWVCGLAAFALTAIGLTRTMRRVA